mmetsp:Transcript_136552/g.436207  ORF Transcript_136552/g.436207 Transcript_136552/m.436207 type:complete len:227 (-) Transcript_136552:248-928(-)
MSRHGRVTRERACETSSPGTSTPSPQSAPKSAASSTPEEPLVIGLEPACCATNHGTSTSGPTQALVEINKSSWGKTRCMPCVCSLAWVSHSASSLHESWRECRARDLSDTSGSGSNFATPQPACNSCRSSSSSSAVPPECTTSMSGGAGDQPNCKSSGEQHTSTLHAPPKHEDCPRGKRGSQHFKQLCANESAILGQQAISRARGIQRPNSRGSDERQASGLARGG